MQTTLERLAPLSGVVFLILLVVAFVLAGETPDTNDPATDVVSFWKDNDSELMFSSAIEALAALALVWFGGSLRQAIMLREGDSGRLATLAFAGIVVAAVGVAIDAALVFATADSAGEENVPAEVTQTLNALYSAFFFPIVTGLAVLLLASGLAAVRTGFLPAWLGWIQIVLTVALFTPVGFVVAGLTALWIAAIGVVLYLRGRPGEPRAPAAGAPIT